VRVRNSRYRYTRLVMVINAFMIGVTGFAFLVFPVWSIDQLGMPNFLDRDWYTRFAGLILVALAAHVGTTSRAAGDKAFQRNAILMIVVCASVASSLYVAPGEVTGFRMFTVVSGGLWSFLYALTLPIKTVGMQEEPAAS
jgi:hypothetical protein